MPRNRLLLLACLALAGCLERIESITLHADGSLDVEHRVTGDADDLDQGAASYPTRAPWNVARTTRRKEDGKVEHILTARARFGSAAEMPTRFAVLGDPFGDRALAFTTEVTVRREEGRAHYRFVRRYRPRTWAPYAHFWRRAFPPDIQEMIDDPDNLWRRTDEERGRLIRAILDFQCMQIQHWAEDALAAVAPEEPLRPEALLAARDAVRSYRSAHLGSAAMERVLAQPVEEIDAFTTAFHREVNDRIVEVVAKRLGFDANRAANFRTALAVAAHDFEITHDLEDENFVVRLEMPGRLTGDNGDAHQGGEVVWRFDDEDLRDRAHVLIATSVVEE